LIDYLFLAAALFAAIHAFSYAVWLRRNGNIRGAIYVFVLIVIAVVLPVYQIMLEN
jgi:drug/metabolite transporter superfamily protein YnfA